GAYPELQSHASGELYVLADPRVPVLLRDMVGHACLETHATALMEQAQVDEVRASAGARSQETGKPEDGRHLGARRRQPNDGALVVLLNPVASDAVFQEEREIGVQLEPGADRVRLRLPARRAGAGRAEPDGRCVALRVPALRRVD